MSNSIPPLTPKDGESKDLVAENIERLKQLFPEIVTEGKVDFEALQEVLGDFKEDSQERYSFTWNGKSKARKLAMTPSRGTLRPAPEVSVNWDSTENLFIEGDNLEVLKLLQRSYHGKVKMIYTDPPYNTGNDFVYEDDFKDNITNYLKTTGQLDDDGKKVSSNPEYSGRFHTDWLNMIYPRLLLAREMLKQDGVIFFNIGEEELHNSINLFNQIFGEENRVSIVSRISKTASNLGTHFAPSIDYILCYAKDITALEPFKDKVDETLYPKVEKDGPRKGEKYRDDVALYQASLKGLRPNQKYFIECPDGSKVIPPCSKLDEVMREGDGRWRWTKDTYLENKDLLVFKETSTSPLLNQDGEQAKYNIYTKSYLNDREESGTRPRNILKDYFNRKGADHLKKYDLDFSFSKPYELIEFLMSIVELKKGDIILDFFAGSCSLAEAVMRYSECPTKFICIQLPEELEKSEFQTVSDLGLERIKRVSSYLLDSAEDQIEDLGVKVFKLHKSNLKPWDPNFNEVQLSIEDSIENIKPDRTEQDVLYEILLKYGLDLSLPIEEKEVAGSKVFVAGAGALFICLAPDIDLDVVEGIAKEKEELEPELTRVVFRDSGFKDDVVKTNAVQILKQHGIEDVRSI